MNRCRTDAENENEDHRNRDAGDRDHGVMLGNINVDLNLEHRQKGLLWYSTYKVAFDGAYSFCNASDKDQNVTFVLNFPTTQAVYDDLVFTVDGARSFDQPCKNSASGTVLVARRARPR